MRRRNLLKGAAAIALQPFVWAGLPARAATKSHTIRRVRPADPSWPRAVTWQKLNDAVGGNLIKVHSLFETCTAEPNGAACVDLVKNYRNPYFLGDQPAGTQVSGWLDAWTPAPSAYAVAVRSTADVVAAVNFARQNNLRVVVKGGAHSYQGTSNAPDSLLIWPRNMKAVTLHDAFVPQGCQGRSEPTTAVTAAAGTVWMDLYDAVVVKAGRYVQGGGCTTVGVPGLVQSGGFGSFSKGFGTAAAGLLEAEIVTADGHALTVNACRHPDLFWAIKGGGGGSWGVITKVTLRTRELPAIVGVANGTIKAASDAAFRTLIARFIAFYKDSLMNPHWGESVKIGSNTLDISMLYQGPDHDEPERVWRPFAEWVKNAGKDFTILDPVETSVLEMRRLWDVADRKKRGSKAMNYDERPGASEVHGWWRGDHDQVGAYLHGYESAWLPETLLRLENQPQLVDALVAASRYMRVDLHFNKGLAGAPAEDIVATRNTATNPVATEAFALAIIATGSAPAYPGQPGASIEMEAAQKNAHNVDAATAELRKIVPNPGSYVSESNYFNESWQTAFWGVNYPKLRAVKDKYDPDGLFFVHHGVGSEDWSADGFTRLAAR
jgi:FAD/FMN-containing dehydrogenase